MSVRRSDFVAACKALLQGEAGAASEEDLHRLFDMLDPQCSGFADLDQLVGMLQASAARSAERDAERSAEQPAARRAGAGGFRGGAGARANAAAAAAVRAWMLRHRWLLGDLEDLLGGPQAAVDWEGLRSSVLAVIKAVSEQDLHAMFLEACAEPLPSAGRSPAQCSSASAGGGAGCAGEQLRGSAAVPVGRILGVLLESVAFSEKLAQLSVQVLALEARARDPPCAQQLLEEAEHAAPGGSTGPEAVAAAAESLAPGALAWADVANLTRCLEALRGGATAAALARAVAEALTAEAAVPPPPPPGSTSRGGAAAAARRKLREAGAWELRKAVASRSPSGPAPQWLSVDTVVEVLRPLLEEEEIDGLLVLVSAASVACGLPAGAAAACAPGGALVRAETLLSCSERCVEHALEVRLDALRGLDELLGMARSTAPCGIFLRCRLHGSDSAVQTTSMRLPFGQEFDEVRTCCKLDCASLHTFRLSSRDSLAAVFEGAAHALTVEVWCERAEGDRKLLTAPISSADLCAFLSGRSDEGRVAAAADGWERREELRLCAGPPTACSTTSLSDAEPHGRCGVLSLALLYQTRCVTDPSQLPLPWTSKSRGASVRRPAQQPERGSDSAALAAPPEDAHVEVLVGQCSLHQPVVLKLMASSLEGMDGPSAALVSERGCRLFLCLWLFGPPGEQQQQPTAAARSPPKALPPFDEVRSLRHESASVPPVEIDFSWRSVFVLRRSKLAGAPPSPDDCGGHPLSAPTGCTLCVELWLAADAAPEPFQLRVAERHVELDPWLSLSPLGDGEGLVRTSVPLEADGCSLGSLDVQLALQGSPPPRREKAAALSGAVASPADSLDLRMGAEARPRATAAVDVWLRVCEVWLPCRAGCGADAYYFLEVGSHRSARPLQHRAFPSSVTGVGGGWLLLAFGEERLHVPAEACDGGIPPTLELLVCTPEQQGPPRTVASASLRLSPEPPPQGAPAPEFAVGSWLALPCSPGSADVGRALVALEVRRARAVGSLDAEGAVRLPPMPAGVALPLGGSWEQPPLQWPWAPSEPQSALRDAVHAAVGEPLCEQLLMRGDAAVAAPGAPPGWVQRGLFEAAMVTAGLREEVSFFRGVLASLGLERDPLVPCMPLLHWLIVRGVARAVQQQAKQVMWAARQLDLCTAGSTGAVPLASLRKVLQTLAPGSAQALPQQMWQFLEQWPPWSFDPGGAQGQKLFDYVAFLSDLSRSGVEGADVLLLTECPGEPAVALPPELVPPPPCGQGPEAAAAAERAAGLAAGAAPLAELAVVNALHLPLVQRRAPNAFVSYTWQLGGQSDEQLRGLRLGESLGKTDVIYRTTCPAWDFAASVHLPLIFDGDRCLPYPDAFRAVALQLHVWHVDSQVAEDGGVLIGSSLVPLLPLLTGFAEVDGYFHIMAPAMGQDAGPGEAGGGSNGQIRVKVRPCHASFIVETDASSAKADVRSAKAGAAEEPPPREPCALPDLEAEGTEPGCAPRTQASLPEGFEPAPEDSLELELELEEAPGSPGVLEDLPSCGEKLRELEAEVRKMAAGLDSDAAGLPPFEERASYGHLVTDAVEMSGVELRLSSQLSSCEAAMSSMDQTDAGQLEVIRECHSRNMAELEELHQRLLSRFSRSWDEVEEAPSLRLADVGSAPPGPTSFEPRRSAAEACQRGHGPPGSGETAVEAVAGAGPLVGLPQDAADDRWESTAWALDREAFVHGGEAGLVQSDAAAAPARTSAGPLPQGLSREGLGASAGPAPLPESAGGGCLKGLLQEPESVAGRGGAGPLPSCAPALAEKDRARACAASQTALPARAECAVQCDPGPPDPPVAQRPSCAGAPGGARGLALQEPCDKLGVRAASAPNQLREAVAADFVVARADSACQTEASPRGKEPATPMLWREIDRLCGDGAHADRSLRRPRTPETAASPASRATLELQATPWTDAGSTGSVLSTPAVPWELRRFRGATVSTLDIETQRIARIMRGCRGASGDDDASSSTSE